MTLAGGRADGWAESSSGAFIGHIDEAAPLIEPHLTTCLGGADDLLTVVGQLRAEIAAHSASSSRIDARSCVQENRRPVGLPIFGLDWSLPPFHSEPGCANLLP
jgi:hypothetical protein